MSPRTTSTEITTKNKKEISNRNSAGAESDSSIDLAIKEFVGAVGKAGRQYVMLSGMRRFRLSIENFMYAALLREYMRIETIIKHLLFLLNLSRFLKGLSLDFLDFPIVNRNWSNHFFRHRILELSFGRRRWYAIYSHLIMETSWRQHTTLQDLPLPQRVYTATAYFLGGKTALRSH